MIYLKARGYAKGSEFGNPTICGKGKNQIEETLKTIKTLLEIGETNSNAIHTIEISFNPYELNPNYKPTKTNKKNHMSDEINTNSLQRHYQNVLDECPEYSDPSSAQYDLAHCADLAQIRFDREADGFYNDN